MDYMDQSVLCSVCGKETSMIATKICHSCEREQKQAAQQAEWDAKSDVEKTLTYLESWANPTHFTFSADKATFVLNVFRAALSPAAGRQAEQKAYASDEWIEKTNWVQEQSRTFPVTALGKHRADVMREEIERLRATTSSAAGQQAIPEGMMLVKSSAIHCANHMAKLAEILLEELNEFSQADEYEEELIDLITEKISESMESLRNEIYEYRKRMAAPTPEGSV